MKMRKDQIPEFVEEILVTGCPICAVGREMYVFAEIDLPEEDMERVSAEVQAICQHYGDRDHLRLDIVAYLRRIGRFVDVRPESVH